MRNFVTLFASLVMMASMAQAETTPDDFIGAPVIERGACTDDATRVSGYCWFVVKDGITYLIFHDDQGALFIRRIIPGVGFRTIWHRDGLPVDGTPL